MNSSRVIPWINYLKAICIVFVFLRHCENYYGSGLGWFDALYLPFYVNVFFFVSGYLLFWKQLSSPKILEGRDTYLRGSGRTLIQNVFFRIVIPSILFASIEFFPKKVIKGDPFSILDFFYETIGGCTYWFTSALVVAQVLFFFLFITRSRSIWFYVIPALLLSAFGRYLVSSGFHFVEGNGAFPWQYKQGLICMIYIAMGGLYWRFEPFVRKIIRWWMIVPFSGLYFFGSILWKEFVYDGYMTSLGRIHVIGVLWSLFSSVLLVELCRIIPTSRVLSFIGKNSIGFYFMSGALPIVSSLVAHRFFSGTHVWVVLIITVFSLAISYMVMKLLTRWAPWLFDLRHLSKAKCR